MARKWGGQVTRNERSRAAARRRDAAPRYGVPGERRHTHDRDVARQVELFLNVPSRTGHAVPAAAVEGDGTAEPSGDAIRPPSEVKPHAA